MQNFVTLECCPAAVLISVKACSAATLGIPDYRNPTYFIAIEIKERILLVLLDLYQSFHSASPSFLPLGYLGTKPHQMLMGTLQSPARGT